MRIGGIIESFILFFKLYFVRFWTSALKPLETRFREETIKTISAAVPLLFTALVSNRVKGLKKK